MDFPDGDVHSTVLHVFLVLLVLMIPVVWFVPSPYGKFYNTSWGLPLNGRYGFMFQEVFSPLILTLSFAPSYFSWRFSGSDAWSAILSDPNWWCYLLWLCHYIHRSLVFPLMMASMSPAAFANVFSATVFNIINGYVNGRSLFFRAVLGDGTTSLYSPQFVIGVVFFFCGMYINISADYSLARMRREKIAVAKSKDEKESSSYFIPHGGLFEYVSCANYTGEILEWISFWMAQSFTLAPFSFMAWTLSMLGTRALHHHHMYVHDLFPGVYPKDRKAVIPFLI